ncbi:uncharacterized protein LOC123700650 [Colias croceus]|uniref:uncharacterized protein LOC123700650 n=1 Tax=Colias crocea TaxID=72248 RepID=UPI001E27B488|nr:uncharacterized protein LOC123700650 [Colias croceus]
MAEKRKRGQNFSIEDKDKLIKLLLQHKNTILNKRTDGSTNEAKNCAWISITESFNSTSNIHRTKESLMKIWEKLKSDSKKYYAQSRRDTSRTGGGPSTVKIDPVLEQVSTIMGRGCTGILGIPDCDAETGGESEEIVKVICIEDEFWETDGHSAQSLEEPNLKSQTHENFKTAEEPKPDNVQELQKEALLINKTPLWSRRRPQISNNTERSEATAVVSQSIQGVYKRKETVEELKEQLLREEIDFKRKLYNFQLQAAAKEVEIKTAVLEQIKGGGISLQNLFGVQNEKKD